MIKEPFFEGEDFCKICGDLRKIHNTTRECKECMDRRIEEMKEEEDDFNELEGTHLY